MTASVHASRRHSGHARGRYRRRRRRGRDRPARAARAGRRHAHRHRRHRSCDWRPSCFHLRILRDEQSCATTGAPLLVVSQFTLYGRTDRGRRPSWTDAAPARPWPSRWSTRSLPTASLGAAVATGLFGAMMQVGSVNDGPFTVSSMIALRPAARRLTCPSGRGLHDLRASPSVNQGPRSARMRPVSHAASHGRHTSDHRLAGIGYCEPTTAARTRFPGEPPYAPGNKSRPTDVRIRERAAAIRPASIVTKGASHGPTPPNRPQIARRPGLWHRPPPTTILRRPRRHDEPATSTPRAPRPTWCACTSTASASTALLTAEQEVELAKRIEAGVFAAHVLESDIELSPQRRVDLQMIVRDGGPRPQSPAGREPAAGRLAGQALHRPRHAAARPDPGGQPRA